MPEFPTLMKGDRATHSSWKKHQELRVGENQCSLVRDYKGLGFASLEVCQTLLGLGAMEGPGIMRSEFPFLRGSKYSPGVAASLQLCPNLCACNQIHSNKLVLNWKKGGKPTLNKLYQFSEGIIAFFIHQEKLTLWFTLTNSSFTL